MLKFYYLLKQQLFRFELYDDVYEELHECKNCTNYTLEEFRLCMADVRNKMEEGLLQWDEKINTRLNEIKEEAEKECTLVI